MTEQEKKTSPHGDEYTNDMLPPEPEKWPTAEELREARLQEPLPRIKGGVRIEPKVRFVIGGKHAFRKKGLRIK